MAGLGFGTRRGQRTPREQTICAACVQLCVHLGCSYTHSLFSSSTVRVTDIRNYKPAVARGEQGAHVQQLCARHCQAHGMANQSVSTGHHLRML